MSDDNPRLATADLGDLNTEMMVLEKAAETSRTARAGLAAAKAAILEGSSLSTALKAARGAMEGLRNG